MPEATLRIGELARRSGVSADLLRAWERRYGLLTPTRTAGGYRLYSADDETRVRSMRAHIAQGLSAAEAARLVRDATAIPPQNSAPAELAAALWSALDAFDDAGAQAAFDWLLGTLGIETVSTMAVLAHPRSPDARRSLARGRRLGGPGALRDRPPASTAAGPRSRLGPRRRPARAARLPV